MKHLDAGFEFWKQSRGFQHKNGEDELLALPEVSATSQELDVLTKQWRDRR